MRGRKKEKKAEGRKRKHEGKAGRACAQVSFRWGGSGGLRLSVLSGRSRVFEKESEMTKDGAKKKERTEIARILQRRK